MAVATAIGKSVEEVFRPFGAWAFDAKHMSKAASYIRDDAWEMFILMAGFEKTAAKDFVSVLSTAQDPESLPTTPKPFLLTPEGMQKRIDELERDLKQTKRSLSGLHSELNSVTLELGGRLERLENSTPTTDAADAILAEANRLYAKGKAMKGSR